MSLLKRHGKSKKVEDPPGINGATDAPQAISSPAKNLFRKSASVELPSDTERPQSRQSAGGKRKLFPAFLSNLFGGDHSTKICEKNEVQNNSENGAVKGHLDEAKSTSHESINSVLSSSSFSYVKPQQIGGKRVKGKRIPVDDPNYGSTTCSNGKVEDSSTKTILEKIKMGLKFKYNLQSCESLQYIDACDDQVVPSNTPPASTKILQKGCSNPELPAAGNKMGQSEPTQVVHVSTVDTPPTPPASTSIFQKGCSVTEAPSAGNKVGQGEPSPASSEPSAVCPRISEKIFPNLAPPAFPLVVKGKKGKKLSESCIQTSTQAPPKLTEVVTASPPKEEEPTSASIGEPVKAPEKEEKMSQISAQTAIQAPLKITEVILAPPPKMEAVVIKRFSESSAQTTTQAPLQITQVISLVPPPKIGAAVVANSTPPKAPVKEATPPASSNPPVVSVPTNRSEKEIYLASPSPSKNLPVVPAPTQEPQKTASPSSSSKFTVASAPPKQVEKEVTPSSSKNIPVASTPTKEAEKEITPSPSNNLPDVSAPTKDPENEPKPSTSKATEETPPPPVSNNFCGATSSDNPSTWSHSTRRKRRAPQPPSTTHDNHALPQNKFTNGVITSSSGKKSSAAGPDMPCGVPTSTTQYAVLTKFTRIQESPPPPPPPPPQQTFVGFEIRPKKKERSCEPPQIIRPTSSFASTSSSQCGTLLPRHDRYQQQHKRSLSEGVSVPSTGTLGRVHKAGKKKAPPPPNPFGDPDAPDDEGEPAPPSSTPSASRNEEDQPVPSTSVVMKTSVGAALPPAGISKVKKEMISSIIISAETEVSAPAPPVTASQPSEAPIVTTTSNNNTTSVSAVTVTSSISSYSISTPTDLPAPLLDLRECSPEVDEETRQNMLNDQQERLNQGHLAHQPDIDIISGSAPDPPETQDNPRNAAGITISESDVLAAQRSLEMLSASVNGAEARKKETELTDQAAKSKLLELRKEAENSPLNVPRHKSRPTSIGSSIYESSLGLLLGRGTSGNTSSVTPEPSVESSPKVAHKPWYKRSGSTGLSIRNLNPLKSKPTTVVNPFSVLVKFSELDKEAERIIQENRRKPLEQPISENMEPEVHTNCEGDTSAATTSVESRAASLSTSAASAAPPTKIFTVAQVHSILEETGEGRGVPSTSQITTKPAATPSPSTSENKPGSSSPPTFQSVHAASKHRQTKPLSPPTNSSTISDRPPENKPETPPTPDRTSHTPPLKITSPLIPTTITPLIFTSNRPTEPEWDCPRCTLKNPCWRVLCEICYQRKDPPASNTSMSSILQRVNLESSNKSVTTTNSTTVDPKKATTPDKSKITHPVKVSSCPIPSTSTISPTSVIPETSMVSAGPSAQKPSPESLPHTDKINNAPPENFLSQLPTKQDISKEEKLQGIKLVDDDPEMELLDIGQLREARLAYFQKPAPPPTTSSRISTTAKIFTQNVQSNNSIITNNLGTCTPPPSEGDQVFTDDETNFIDDMLQLASCATNESSITTVANISTAQTPLPELTAAAQVSNRYRPKLAAIREGSSQEYAGCYSSSEMAQIYENMQFTQNRDATKVHRDEPLLINSSTIVVDHQPSHAAKNRLSTSPEENYVNSGVVTPTLISETLNISYVAPNNSLSPVFTYMPRLPGGQQQQQFFSNQNSQNLTDNRLIIALGGASGGNNYENGFSGQTENMSSRRQLAYEDYRRMGAIPKGFTNFNSNRNRDEWSSESSFETDSARGFQGRGAVSNGHLDIFPGITRAGTLDGAFPQVAFPDQTAAVEQQMRRLETAIAGGDHRLAATLAHDLALMKVNCVVAKTCQPFTIRVYVEDRFMQQGPFLVRVTSVMTVNDLKAKIESDWGIPGHFQKWILGRKMAEDDSQSLSVYELGPDSMAFLFLVTPEIGNIPCIKTSLETSQQSNSHGQPVPHVYKNTPSPIEDLTKNITANMEPKPVASDSLAAPPPLPKISNKSPSPSRKTSTAVQTTNFLGVTSHIEEPPAPPLPPRSPIPHFDKEKPMNQQQNSKTTKKKEEPQLSEDTISATTALTMSLQQKLAQFKAVTEKTFGKSEAALTPCPSPKRHANTKENTPTREGQPTKIGKITASNSIAENSKEAHKREVNDIKITPPIPRARNTDKNRNAKKRDESLEKPRSPENRFNGVLLPSCPADNKPLKPPERSEKKVSESDSSSLPKQKITRNSPSLTKSSKIVSAESENQRAKSTPPPSDTAASKRPPRNPHKMGRDNLRSKEATPEKAPQTQDTSPGEILVKENTALPPQPKPRSLKKQVSLGQRNHESEENLPKTSESPSKPAPEIMSPPISKNDAVENTMETGVTITDTKHEDLPAAHAPLITTVSTNSSNQVAIDEFCQTTLPFPASRQNKPNNEEEVASPNLHDNTNQNLPPLPPPHEIPVTSGSEKKLLRPSSFILHQQGIKSENMPQNFTLPTTPTSFTEAPSGSVLFQMITANPALTRPVTPPPTEENHQDELVPSSNKEDDSGQSYLEMLEMMEKQDLISTMEDAECPVCFMSVPRGEGVVLRDCLHVFCRECLVGCVQHADDSSVKCPYRDCNYACNNSIQEREIKALVPGEIFEKYLARSVKLAESAIVNTFHCKTPDCTGWCVFEDDVNMFLCPVCKKRNCLTCAAIHDGVDCLKYQRELAIAAETDEDAKQSRLMLEKMIQRGEALECPACHVVLLKKWGCDWVRCSYCKTEICWVTKGFRWGKGGKGDVSGGCKCGVNGVRCHPKCTYCH